MSPCCRALFKYEGKKIGFVESGAEYGDFLDKLGGALYTP